MSAESSCLDASEQLISTFQGIHANDIAKKNNTDPTKAGMCTNYALNIGT
jgi:hypothetical protein